MPNFFDDFNESISSFDNVTQEGLNKTVQFGAAGSYKDQMSALKNDDAFKESTFLLLLADAFDDGGCMPKDSENSYEDFRVCIETQTLRKAIKTKEKDQVQNACDEINSNRDARAVYDRLTTKEKDQVKLKSSLDQLGQKTEILVPEQPKERRS